MAKPHTPTESEQRPGFASLVSEQRDILAKRVADAPAIWISIPTWGRLWVNGRRLLRLDRGHR
jgi:hypothetical protein